MQENVMYDIVSDYIDNEIQYIEGEIDNKDYEINKEDYDKDLEMLKSLNSKDIFKIVNKVLDDNQLNEVLNETIHFYLYH